VQAVGLGLDAQMHCRYVSETLQLASEASMTRLVTPHTLADDVVALLSDRVPTEILDRVLLELDDAGRDESSALLDLLGRGVVTAALRHTWPAASSYCLFAVRAEQLAPLVSRLTLHALAFRREVLHCRTGRTLWLLVSAESQGWVRERLQEPTMPTCLALHQVLGDLRLAPAVSASLEELLVLGERRGWTGTTHTFRLAAARRVEALLDIAARQPELLDGRIAALTDDPQHAVLAETLLTWFRHDRDMAATAAAMHLHVNTVRYRLRRAQEAAGLDLSDWDERLLAEVQLRMWHENRQAAGFASRFARCEQDV
jgi:PucR C-terminal helix-turn-helix domain